MKIAGNYDDAELIRDLKADAASGKVIEYLYRSNFEALSIHIQQNQGSRQDAEDIFQEVIVAFIELVQKDKFRGESSIKTFLFSINKNMWLNELKRRNRAVVREQKFETAKEPADADSNDHITAREARHQVIDVMNKLGDVCKKILLAFYYENQSMKEIVKTMNYENEQVLRNKKHKCLKSLEQLLTADPALAKTLKTALQHEQ
ncbi:MAG: sigma-70 family RNA polymerase sigma factor [Ferruginibacter sp.]